MKKKLKETNVKYKTSANKHWHSNIFEVGDSMMVFLHREQFSAGTYCKFKPKIMVYTSYFEKSITMYM